MRRRAEVLSDLRDDGQLRMAKRTFEDLCFSNCSLSMTGSPTQSVFEDCTFRRIRTRHCHVGHPIFRRCHFEDVSANDLRVFYDARFIECTIAGKLRKMNFGVFRHQLPFFSEERLVATLAEMAKSSFALDIREAEVDDCGFQGEEFVAKLRFHPHQGFLVRGRNLDRIFAPILKATPDPDFATTIVSPAGFGQEYALHFCAIPLRARSNHVEYAARVRDLGVEVVATPLC